MTIAKLPQEEKIATKMQKLQGFALDHFKEAVFLIDENAQLKYVNKSACRYLNYSKDKLLTMSIHDLDPNFPHSRWTEQKKKFQTYKNHFIKTEHKTKDGKTLFVTVNIKYVEYDGIKYYMLFVKDIAEHIREIEEEEEEEIIEVEEKSEQMRLFFDRQLVGMAITSPQNEWLHINDKLCEMSGYSREELQQMTWKEMTHPKDLAAEMKQFERLLKGEIKEYMLEKRFFHKNGTVVYTNLSVNCVYKDDKSIDYIVAFLEDITLRKKAEEEIKILNAQLERHIEQRGVQLEEAVETLIKKERKLLNSQRELQETQLKLSSIISTIPDLIWMKDIDGFYMACNTALEKFYDKAESEIIGKTDYDFFPKEGADMCKQSDMQALATRAISISKEEFIYPEDKTTGMLEIRKTPVYKPNGELMGMLGIARDVTKNNQAKLQFQEAIEFNQGVINAIPDLLFEVDGKGTYLNVWAQQPELLAKQKELLLGNTINQILSPQAAEIAMRALQEADERGHSFGKIFSIDLPNTTNWFELSVSKIQGRDNRFLVISRDITQRKMIEQKIEHMAHHDTLTELPNRIVAKERTEQAIAFAKRDNTKIALIFIDLDGFKSINDSLGHSIGDDVLKIVAARIKNVLRESDTVSRQGGDEFLIILPDIQEIKDVVTIIEKLLYKFESSFDVGVHAVSTSTSIGVALYPDHGDTFETLLQNADTAMYKAKDSGKNTYRFFTLEMKENLIKQFKIQNDLKNAIANNEFILHYQPQVDLTQNRITGAEALIRWRHPELGIIPPMDFIPIAESNGLIVAIGEWVIMQACSQAALWAKEGVEITMAVNISAVQFKRGNLEEVVKKALASSGLNPSFLELELTESIMIHDAENILRTVQRLKELGIKLSIDDFGTGYSSLSYLKRFAVDKLKIDQSFVKDIFQDNDDVTIVKTIIQMAKNLNLKTIAEGVEDERVLDIVHGLGCDEVQGFHFAKPMESAEFEKFQREFMSRQMNTNKK